MCLLVHLKVMLYNVLLCYNLKTQRKQIDQYYIRSMVNFDPFEIFTLEIVISGSLYHSPYILSWVSN